MSLVLRSLVRATDAPKVAALGLVAVEAGAIAALASTHETPPAPTEAELRAHAAITGQVHELAPSLPARFGAFFADADELARAFAPRAADLASELDAIGGRVEMALTLAWVARREPASADAPTTGRAYLEASAARERERQAAGQLAERLLAELGYEQAFTRQCICPRDGVAATVALLIPRDEVKRVRQHVEAFRERTTEVTLAAYGPLAPYSFAS